MRETAKKKGGEREGGWERGGEKGWEKDSKKEWKIG